MGKATGVPFFLPLLLLCLLNGVLHNKVNKLQTLKPRCSIAIMVRTYHVI